MGRKRKLETESQKDSETAENMQVADKRCKNEKPDVDQSAQIKSNAKDVSSACGISSTRSSDEMDLFMDNTPPPSCPSPCRSSQSVPSLNDVKVLPEKIKLNKVKMMPSCPEKAINVAVASRALFTLDEEHDLYQNKGLQEYLTYQIKHEDTPLDTGTAFPFVQALEHVNSCLRSLDEKEENIFNIVLMSHNHAHTGVRLIRSLLHHNLNIQRVCLTGGSNPVDYLEAYNIGLYLTSYPEEVEQALEKGFAAATMLNQKITDPVRDQLRIAFDLDAVLFSDDSDKVYQAHGFAAFIDHEQEHADQPIREGPLKVFATAIGRMQQKFKDHRDVFHVSPIRIYVVTARSACVGERALKTLRSWGLVVDELHFLSGASKGPILAAIKPHIFFDDADHNIVDAEAVGTPAAHVRHGQYTKAIFTENKEKVVRKMSFYNTGTSD